MSEMRTEELQQRVRDAFGRELSAAHVEANRPRLLVMLSVADLLDRWAPMLDRLEPSSVHRTPTLADLGLEGHKHG